MKIIAIEHEIPGHNPDDFKAHLEAEAQSVWQLYQRDILREIYFRADKSDAILVLECPSVKEAQTFLDDLPLVRAGLIKFELIPLKPYPGFSRLFADKTTGQP